MDEDQFIIVEFDDGPRIILSIWCDPKKLLCIWPSHMKTNYRINKAIIAREVPRERSDWEELPIKRIFGEANSYEQSIQKLTQAQNISNIDDSEMSSDDLQEKQQRRKLKAKIKLLSSSSEEDICSKNNKKKLNIRKNQILSPFPDRGNFELTDEADKPIENISHEKNYVNPRNSNEFEKQVLEKLNKLLDKSDNLEKRNEILENRIKILEEKMQCSCHTHNSQECDNNFPISTITELQSFDDQLEEIKFKDKVLNDLKFIGGINAHTTIRNIMKKVITDIVAQNFSWTGRKNKYSFKDLNLSKVIIQAIRIKHKEVTENDIAEYISKWLAQASVRIQRQTSGRKINKKRTRKTRREQGEDTTTE